MATKLKPASKAPLLHSTDLTDFEVIGYFYSESKPDRKPYETTVNRFTGKVRCSCTGFDKHGHCWHSRHMLEVATSEGYLYQIRKGKRAEPKAVIEDFDPFADLGFSPTELEAIAQIEHEAEFRAYRLCQVEAFCLGGF